MEYHIITILAIVVIYDLWRYYHKDKQPEYCSSTSSEENGETIIQTETISAMDNNELPKEEKPATKDLAYSILHKLGCVPEETEDGRIRLEFQGITFLMEAVNDCLFVNLIWPWCHSFSIFDIDEFSRVQIPNIEEYMKVMFRSFFVAQRELVTEIEKYRLQECEK